MAYNLRNLHFNTNGVSMMKAHMHTNVNNIEAEREYHH